GRMAQRGDERAAALAARVVVAISDGSRADRPTLEVRDDGIGIAPPAMPQTILNLAGSNKIDKPYLAGAYGQGGSTTFAFASGGSVIASASADSDVGVTFVRYRALDPRRNKNGRYEYLARTKGGAVGALDARRVGFARGTLVRHFDYELTEYTAHAYDPTASMSSLLGAALFDPILPFSIAERRRGLARLFDADEPRIERGRFAALARAGPALEHRQSISFPFGRGHTSDVVSVHYWVLAADGDPLHPDPQHPVVITNYGQTHGTLDRRFIVDVLRLPFLKEALVVQVELDALSAATKRELISTTRDRLKRGGAYGTLLDAARDALLDDPALQAANTARRRRLLERQSATDQKRLRRRFMELLEKFHPGADPGAAASRNGKSESATASLSDGGDSAPDVEPLATQAHPTFVRIAGHVRPLQLSRGRNALIRLESDAPDAYCALHAQARLVLVADPLASLEVLRVSDFRGGRARVTVRPVAEIGTLGTAAIRLTDAEGTVHVDAAEFTIVEPPPPTPAEADGRKGMRLPQVYEVYRSGWERLGFDETSVSSVTESRDDYSIWINMENRHLHRLLSSVDYQEHGLVRMRASYLVQVAFYAFLMHDASPNFVQIDGAELDAYQRAELDRVARTVITSIASVERIDSAALVDAEN
ncbi:MAG: hypothetical protein GIX01_04870, partial [Candidatus Eremiobacteraeota bacterium]|nr:hypothetical protein [Candidatus Eremiobacteraeota bacterium]